MLYVEHIPHENEYVCAPSKWELDHGLMEYCTQDISATRACYGIEAALC